MSEQTSDDVVLQELDSHGVLLLTWNRPARNNGWSIQLEEAYFGALIDAANDPRVKSIVVTGAGRTFCPGMDISTLERTASGEKPTSLPRRWPMTTARLIPKPVIAAINGACAGIGFIQAACADIRFAARGARFTTAFARRGLPAENALSWILPRLIGQANAVDLLLSARVIDADEAMNLGFLNGVVEPDRLLPTALAYARDLADNCSPNAMAMIKQQIGDDWNDDAESSRLKALVLMSEAGQHPDFAEGVKSFTEKRPPNFPGLAAQLKISKSINR